MTKKLYTLTFTALGPEKADIGGVVDKLRGDFPVLEHLRLNVQWALRDTGWLNPNPSWAVDGPEVAECSPD